MKKLFYSILFLLVFTTTTSYAATFNVASPYDDSDVQDAIDSANTGDTVSIPACTVTWGTTVDIPNDKKITLMGAGDDLTHITRNGTAVDMNSSGSRLTGIEFILNSGTYQVQVAGTGWRIDNCKFNNDTGSSIYSIQAYGTGLIDNNDIDQGKVLVAGQSSFSGTCADWAKDSVIGTVDAVYIEDNDFYKDLNYAVNCIDSNHGASFVARFNTVTGQVGFMSHSLIDDSFRGTRSWEIYNNSFDSNGGANYYAIWMRAGTGMIFNNTISTTYSNDILFDIVRVYQAVSGTGPTGKCDGSSDWDANDEAAGWACRDQIGRGKDASLWTAENPYPAQASEPTYLWLNRTGGSISAIAWPNGAWAYIDDNRDYYNEASSFDGSSGTGTGTLANIPGTCATGVGYWATDQGSWNASGDDGVLYKCTSTDTWEVYYTPYTYPHPLRGTEPTTPQPDPMTWDAEPYGASTTTISMTGTTCSDLNTPIFYTFDFDPDGDDCGTNADIGTGGTDSGAQESDTTYTDDTLQVNQAYCYACTATDSYGTPQTNVASSTVTVYTLAATPTVTTYENEGDTTVEILAFGANGNPAATPETTFALQMVTCTPADTDWQDKWVQSDGSAGASEAWMSATTINALTISGLETATTYGIKAKAINGDSIETALGSEGQFATTGAYVSPPLAGVKGLRITGMSTR